jgi:hypothetical protein
LAPAAAFKIGVAGTPRFDTGNLHMVNQPGGSAAFSTVEKAERTAADASPRG